MKLKQVAAALGVTAAVFTANVFAVDKDLPKYEAVSGISGKISSTGSDTLANMMAFWTQEFSNEFYPSVTVQVAAAGSSTAPPALTEGTSNFGPMSRKMKSGEVEAFEKKYGYKPTPIRVAIDALAVFVNKDNPIEGLTIKQVDAIFSSTRKCGEAQDTNNWGQLGLPGDWTSRDLQLYGRNSVSGTYGYFKSKALCKGDFKSSVNEQPGSASVVQSISASLNAIGYSGIGYLTSGVKAVPLSKDGKTYVEATMANALTGAYPLSRYLYVYVNKHPNRDLSPLEAEFVKYMLSSQGQKIVEKDGYIPVPAKVTSADLKKLGLN
ncbi:PstS family phosphate ABC transporter substrate-binding protein [Echinimonas agarilytica]|uniref:Phosphate-binding protein n=1 Tax=Echinimonas agarilytica TaxID=1215918 RepID=A0AA41W850_9GAMM|nr:phosphate ABC transporter substrate-binding protein PstS family protein [Echinimonas agarilytica]MCM2680178.1 phosphate ABC transporter substrate-binding protein PstS family protein [Echinimonas agarilytica]